MVIPYALAKPKYIPNVMKLNIADSPTKINADRYILGSLVSLVKIRRIILPLFEAKPV